MAGFDFVTTLDAGIPHLAGITDMVVHDSGGGPVLYSGSETDGGLTAFSLAAGQAASYFDQIGASANRGTYGLASLDSVTVNGQSVLVPGGRHDDRLAFHKLTGSGDLNGIKALGGDSSILGNLEEVATMQVAGKTFMVASQWGQSGFQAYRIRDDLSVEHKRSFSDTASANIADITDIATVQVAGRNYFFTASAGENGITSWWMGKWGNVKERGSLDPGSGLWVSAPSAVEATVVGGTAYVVLGAAGSNSLTVMRMNVWGGLFVTDHLIDDRDSRFAGVAAMDIFEVGGRSFLLAGGSDDGLSLFEIAPGGRLLDHGSVADQVTTRLANVSAIETAVFGSEVQVFVASGSETGVTQFSLDFSSLGIVRSGGAAANTLTGGGADDLIFGSAGDDTLSGGGGDDTLIDGTGIDSMTGGAGADRFVFYSDGRMDTVTDFTPGEDKLDLSDYPMLYTMDRLSFTQKSYGVLITYGTDRFRIEADGQQLMVADLSADDFIF